MSNDDDKNRQVMLHIALYSGSLHGLKCENVKIHYYKSTQTYCWTKLSNDNRVHSFNSASCPSLIRSINV